MLGHETEDLKAPRRRTDPGLVCLLVSGFFLFFLAAAVAQADEERTSEVKRTFDLKGKIEVRNLAGKVTVGRAPGASSLITATVHAVGASEAEAKELLAALDVQFDEADGGVEVRARYPLDRHTEYAYLGGTGSGKSTTRTTYEGKRVTVTTSKASDAAALWVDFDVLLAPGSGFKLEEVVGEVAVSDVEGSVSVEVGMGDLFLSSVKGSLEAETGSGDVSVKNHRGDIQIGTGSGDLTIDGTEGEVVAETGSGDVVVAQASGKVKASTGSGDVEVRDSKAALHIETGSGDALLKNVSGGDVRVGTGSGSIKVESPALFKSPTLARARLETGSGDIYVTIDDQASMRLDFESGSGTLKASNALNGKVERTGAHGHYRCRIGAGESEVEAGTGSGDLMLRLASE